PGLFQRGTPTSAAHTALLRPRTRAGHCGSHTTRTQHHDDRQDTDVDPVRARTPTVPNMRSNRKWHITGLCRSKSVVLGSRGGPADPSVVHNTVRYVNVMLSSHVSAGKAGLC